MKRLTVIATLLTCFSAALNTHAAPVAPGGKTPTVWSPDAAKLFRVLQKSGFTASSVDGDEIHFEPYQCVVTPETSLAPDAFKRKSKIFRDQLNAQALKVIALPGRDKPPKFCIDPKLHC